MKINYTNFLRGRPHETNPERLTAMRFAVTRALADRGIASERATCEYYKDGRVKVEVSGEFYGIFDTTTEKFFSGCVGDYPAEDAGGPGKDKL